MNSLEIRTASLADLQYLLDIERKSFEYDIITLKRMRHFLKSKTAIVIKAISSSLLVGYMILLTRKNSGILRIYSLAIVYEERRLGFGRKLLRYAEDYGAKKGFERIHLELHASNTPALIFYLSEGYCLYGRRENYYTDGAQALLLRKSVLPGGIT